MKKGISPLIATVLLIAFVVIIAGAVYYWASNYLEKTKNQANKEIDVMDATNKIDYTVDDATYVYSGNIVKFIQGLVVSSDDKMKKVKISLTNNGNFKLDKFVIVVYDVDGNTYVDQDFLVDLEPYEHKEVEFKFDTTNLSEIDYFKIIPKVGDRAIEAKAIKFRAHN